jgi:riboflavin kinase / FMN adenylyltransferase
LEPDRFVSSVLMERLNVSSLTVGADFHFGRDRAGDVPFLKNFGAAHGFSVEAVDLVVREDLPVSSSQIRNLVEAGDVASAADLMGSPFRFTNVVIDGDKRGRAIGFPTANLRPLSRKCLPADGVYACRAEVRGKTYQAATNVGVRPTFGGGERLVEAYILDFDEEIYGEELTLEFVERLRSELRFDSVDDLVSRMTSDVDQTRDIVGSVRG